MKVGSITFGPAMVPDRNTASGYRLQSIGSTQQPFAQACNCVGPQPGQTKCPCALVKEAEMGRRMIEEGVTINGKRYRLVEDPQ